MKSSQKQLGFTLMEALLYMAILVVILSVVVSLFLWAVRSQAKAQATRTVADNTRNVVQVMLREIREAHSLYTPTMTASNQLSLETRQDVPSGETSTYLDFFLCGTRVCLKREFQNPIALTSEQVQVTNLKFVEVSTGSVPSVQIIFDMVYDNPNNKPELDVSVQIQTTSSMRSY
jgi:type II secretory pathway pseudopilin PulG